MTTNSAVRFSGTPFDCCLVLSCPQQTLGRNHSVNLIVVVAVEKWKAFCALQAQRLFHGHAAGRSRYGLMLILIAAGEHDPCDPGQLIRNRHDDFVAWCPCCQPMDPLPKTAGVILHPQQYRPGSMHEQLPQAGSMKYIRSYSFIVGGLPQVRCGSAPAS